MRVGDKVKIISGPLAGMNGMLLAMQRVGRRRGAPGQLQGAAVVSIKRQRVPRGVHVIAGVTTTCFPAFKKALSQGVLLARKGKVVVLATDIRAVLWEAVIPTCMLAPLCRHDDGWAQEII